MSIRYDERARRLEKNLAAARMGEPEKFRARAWLQLTRVAGAIGGCSIHREWTILALLVAPERALPERAAAPVAALRSAPAAPIDLRQHKVAVVSWDVEVLARGTSRQRLRWTLGLECGHTVQRTGPGREVDPLLPSCAYPPPLPSGRRFSWRPTRVSCETCSGKAAWDPYGAIPA